MISDIKSRKEDVCALLAKPYESNHQEFKRLVRYHGIEAENEKVW